VCPFAIGGVTHLISSELTKTAGAITFVPNAHDSASGRKFDPLIVIMSPPIERTDAGETCDTAGVRKMSIASELPMKSTPFSLMSTATKPSPAGTTVTEVVVMAGTPCTVVCPKRMYIDEPRGAFFVVCVTTSGYPPADGPMTGRILVILRASMKV
jgi:hypothetical protein